MTKFWFLKELGSRSSSDCHQEFFLIFVNISPKRLIKVKTLKTSKNEQWKYDKFITDNSMI